jgi:hypothetical protein
MSLNKQITNVNYYEIEALKQLGINFELIYSVEFTQKKNVYNNGNIKYKECTVKEFNDLESALKLLREIEDSEYTLYSQLNIKLVINDMIVMEDTLLNLPATQQEVKMYNKYNELEEAYNSDTNNFKTFLQKYNSEKLYKDFLKEKEYVI